MQPHAPRRIGCWQLVSSQVLDQHVDVQLSITFFHTANAHTRALRLKKVDRPLCGGGELTGQCGHAQVLTIVAEHALHQKICADKVVMSCTLTRLSEEGGHRSVALHLWHVRYAATPGKASAQAVHQRACRPCRGRLCTTCGKSRKEPNREFAWPRREGSLRWNSALRADGLHR